MEVVPPFTMIVPDVNDNDIAVGCEIVTEVVTLVPTASVTV